MIGQERITLKLNNNQCWALCKSFDYLTEIPLVKVENKVMVSIIEDLIPRIYKLRNRFIDQDEKRGITLKFYEGYALCLYLQGILQILPQETAIFAQNIHFELHQKIQ